MRVYQETVTGFAHCPDARCGGYTQQEVPAVKHVKEVTCVDRGGDLGLVENSFERFRFADENDRACPGCGKPRVVTGEPRPAYDPMSGHDPMGLLTVKGFDPARQMAGQSAEVEALRAELAELKAMIREQAAA